MNYSRTIREYCLQNPGMMFDMSYEHKILKWFHIELSAKYYQDLKMKEY